MPYKLRLPPSLRRSPLRPEDIDELHRLAQPLVDHVDAGKLAKRVCDLIPELRRQLVEKGTHDGECTSDHE